MGNRRYSHGTLQLSSSYLTGGDTITPAMLGFGREINAIFISPTSGYVPTYTPGASAYTIKVYWTGASASGVLAEYTSGGSALGTNINFPYFAIGR